MICTVVDVLGPLAADRIAASRKPAAVKAPASPVALPALKSSSSKVIIEEAAEPEPSKLPHAMIRLNNNSIADIAPLYRVLEVTLMDPAALVWIGAK